MIGAHKGVVQIVSDARFASLEVRTPTLPHSAWRGVFYGLREPIGPGLYADALDVFEVADEQAGEGDGDTRRLARVPLLAQSASCSSCCKCSTTLGRRLRVWRAKKRRTEYEDGAKILFALATTLYAFIAARADVLSKR